MKLFRANGGAMLIATAILSAAGLAGAQTLTCGLQGSSPCGSGTAKCAASCGPPLAVYHFSGSPCGTAGQKGSYDLTKTQFANTCYSGTASCPIGVPPFRFWQYNNWAKANNGCDGSVVDNAYANGVLDGFGGTTPGYWLAYQANWSNPLGDGCILSGGEQRTVLEVSFPDQPSEGTLNHKSWYAIGAVAVTNDYDFDTISGSAGCTASTVPAINVDGVTITGGSPTFSACGSTTVSVYPDNSVNAAGFFDVPVTLVTPSPDYYTEQGKSPASKSLIAGYQILYAGGTTMDATSEPKTSIAGATWKPVLDPADPTKARAFVAYGTAGSTSVSIPKGTCSGSPVKCPWYWLATRLVYTDATENPANSFDPATTGPLLVSAVSGHCGPVAGGSAVAVNWADVSAERISNGVRVSFRTTMEDDTMSFQLVRTTIAANGSESVPEMLQSFVDARGAYSTYDLVDSSIDKDLTTTYAYYVQEITTHGYGSRSPRAVVPSVSAPTGTSGGRTRGHSRSSR